MSFKEGILIGFEIADKNGSNVITTLFQTDSDYEKQFNAPQNVLYVRNNKSISEVLDARRYMPYTNSDDTFIKHSVAVSKENVNSKHLQGRVNLL